MLLTIGSLRIEHACSFFSVRLGNREVFIQRPEGQPFRYFDDWNPTKDTREV